MLADYKWSVVVDINLLIMYTSYLMVYYGPEYKLS